MKNNWTQALFPIWLITAFAVLFLSVPSPAYAAKCGGVNQRPCTVFERIPSCNMGLRESLGKCIVLKPGDIPIFATTGEWSSELARVAEDVCINALSGYKGGSMAAVAAVQ